MRALLTLLFLGAGACFDFGLDERPFRCDGDPDICGAGMICDEEGVCVRDVGQEICNNGEDDDGDELVDCADVECGQQSCDDENPCTIDTCASNGICDSEPTTSETCGNGCVCEPGGVAVEVACGDLVDNDGDAMPDCQDDDCPMCSGGLQCCPDGACRVGC